MPGLLGDEATIDAVASRSVQIGDLPRFNAGDPNFRITRFGGWFSPPVPDAVYVPNGGGAGAVASGAWMPKEKAYQLSGVIWADRAALEPLARLLWQALPADRDAPLVVYGNGLANDLQTFVRRYDAPEVEITSRLAFTVPLIALDPYRYGLTPLTEQAGVFSGQQWARKYELIGGKWVRRYQLVGGKWVRKYEQAVSTSAYPDAATLISAGDATSRRVDATVSGPLTAGDWWLINETTGERLIGNFGVTSEQTVTVDNFTGTADMNGSDVSHAFRGDWLSLVPGPNVFRLVAGSQTGAHASFSALEAYL